MKKESRYGPMDKNLRTGYLHYTTRSLVQILERFCESPVGADARVMLVLPEGRSPMQKEFSIRSKPKNKHKRRQHKKYKGQGRRCN